MLLAVILVLVKAKVNDLGGKNITVLFQIAKIISPQKSNWKNT